MVLTLICDVLMKSVIAVAIIIIVIRAAIPDNLISLSSSVQYLTVNPKVVHFQPILGS